MIKNAFLVLMRTGKAFFIVNIHVVLAVYLFTCLNKYSKIKQKFYIQQIT